VNEQARYPYLHVLVSPDDAELASAELWELGAAGIEERDGSTLNASDAPAALTLVASFADEASALAAREALARRWPARLTFLVGDAWRDGWKAYFKPTRIGDRLVIGPSWEPYAPAPGEVVVTLDPGAAFGTGTHESTQLVLRTLQPHVAPGTRVLDVGCGSGILSIACLLLGAERAHGLDVDPEAVRVALENAERNGVADRFSAGSEPLTRLHERFPLVLANIESRVLVPLAAELAATVAPGGVLILSGLLATEREQALAAYPDFTLEQGAEQGDWIALVLRSRQ
jgi:ribosomal protein L11 methyltransferase